MIHNTIMEVSSTMDIEKWKELFYLISKQSIEEYIVKCYHEWKFLKDITLWEFLIYIEWELNNPNE